MKFLLARTLSMIIALTVTGAACGMGKSKPQQAEVVTPAGSTSAIATVDLQRVSIEAPSLLDDYPPAGFQVFPGSGGRVFAPDGEVILTGTQGRPILSVRRAPGEGDLLVHFGSGNYWIYNLKGAVIADLSEVHPLFEGASAAIWRWKDSRSLVGVTEISPLVKQPRYPDGDVLPARSLLLLYEPYDDPKRIYLLKAPEPAAGTVIRLEGVTENGMLLLSAVEPQQYFGGPPRKILGGFEGERP